MTDTRHQRLKELFEGARTRAEPERARFLDEHCDDAEMRREVLALLALHDASPDFLAEPALGSDFRLPDAEGRPSEPLGEVPDEIGRYRIIGLLGSGGMGAVYEARQESPRRTVALKVIRPGVATAAMLRRFEHEAQMLARLQHPGIAQIFEAGTFGEGQVARPFFAMELIHGRTIIEYCEARGAGTRERLALVARVCDAVHHAHQHGVVHRDLKPANILVDERGQPKILDFGVARAIHADTLATTLRTDVGQLVGTLPYMSPEQVLDDPRALDTRSDVYALGVLCYELVAGRLPLDVRDKTIAESARIIQDASPARLSSIDRAFRGDIETIVSKALEKDKQRRYQSASDLAADIRRYLADEPIVARPASALYQFRKFTKRNRALVAAAALAFAALTAALVVSTVFWRQAERRGRELSTALEASELEANKVIAINEFLIGMLRSVDPGMRGREVSVREVLDHAAVTIGNALDDQPLVEAALRQTIATSYAGLGRYGDALDHARQALGIRTARLGEDDPETLSSMSLVASQLDRLGRYEEAEPLIARTLQRRRVVLGEHHPDTLSSRANLAFQRYRAGHRKEAEALWLETLEMCERVLDPDDPITLAVTGKLAMLYQEQGRYAEAETHNLRGLEIRRRTLGAEHPQTLAAMVGLGRIYQEQARYGEAEAMLTDALSIRRRVLGDEHADTLRCMDAIGWLYILLGRHEEAESILVEELEIRRRLFGENHPGTPWNMNTLSVCYQAQGRWDESEALKLEALAIRRETLGDDHPDTLISMNNLAALYYSQGRYDEAESRWSETLAIRRRIQGPEHPETLMSMHNLALLYAAQGRYGEAEDLHVRTLEIRRRRLGNRNQYTLRSMSNLAALYLATGRTDDALPLLDEALRGARESLPAGHHMIGQVQGQRGQALLALRRFAEAETALLDACAILEASVGGEHGETIEAMETLVDLYDRLDRPDDAETWRAALAGEPEG